MEHQHYNHVNQNDKNNDYYNRSSSTTTSSSSSSTTTTIGRETKTTSADGHTTTVDSQEQLQSFRKFLTQMFMEHFAQDYQDAIGTRPVQLIIKEVREQLEKGNITPTQVSRALQQTAYAPRPSWAYARAIIRRMVRDGEYTENDVPF